MLSASPTISIDDVTVDVQQSSMEFIDAFVPAGAHLDNPRGMVKGPHGNLFVTSYHTNSVLRYDVDTGDLLDEFVKDGSGGLNGPKDLAFGPDGNGDGVDDLYVSNGFGDNVLRYNGTTGEFIDEFVESGSGGLAGAGELLFHTDGDLYVSNGFGDNILRYNGTTGEFIDEFVESGSGGLDSPGDLAFGPDGNDDGADDLYVSSYYSDSVLRYNGKDGAFLDAFVPAESDGLDAPAGLLFDSAGNLYVAGLGNYAVLCYDRTGALIRELDTTEDGLGRPNVVIFDNANNLLVSGFNSDLVDRYNAVTGAFIEVVVENVPGAKTLESPSSVVFDSGGDLYVGDSATDSIFRFDGVTGALKGEFVAPGSGGLDRPEELVFGPDGRLYVHNYDSVLCYDSNGAFDGQFVGPIEYHTGGMAFGPDGNFYLAAGDSVSQYDGTTGAFLGEFIPSGSGVLNSAGGFAFGPDGDFYIASTYPDCVLRYDGLSGAFLGEFVTPGSGGLSSPDEMAFAPNGDLLLSDQFGSVWRYDGETGQYIDTVASLRENTLDYITNMAFDTAGNLYVASDGGHDEILRYGAVGQAAVTVGLSNVFDETVTVDYATSNGTATAGEDYNGMSGTLTFRPGVTTRTILIPTSQDAIEAPSESFYVTLSNPSPNALIADSQGEVTILERFKPVTLFADSFENGEWNGKWVEDSQRDWYDSTQRATDGNYSAEVDGRATDAALTMANPIDMTPYGSAELTFDWLIEKGLDSGEYLALDLFNGTSWQEVAKLRGNVDAENTWHHEVLNIDSNYLVDNFQLRFRGKMSGSDEDADVDNVRLVATSLATPPNVAPTAGNDSYSVAEDDSVMVVAPGVLANDSDADGDSLTAVLVGGPSHGTLSFGTDGSFTYTPAANFFGGDSFTYRANDGTVNSNLATVSITVDPVNDAPVATADDYVMEENTTLDVSAPGLLANDSDADGDSLTAVLVDNVSNGALALITDGSFTYTPDQNFTGTDSFTYRANDGNDASNLVTVSITVNRVNDAPVATGDNYNMDEDGTLTVVASGVLKNDTDTDPLTAELTTDVSHGTLTLNANGSFTYEPAANFYGTDAFTYKAFDGIDYSNVATVSITVQQVVSGPTLDKGLVLARTDAWTSVTLDNTYTSMVVVLTPSYDKNQVPMVARMSEMSGNTFEVRLDRTDGQTDVITDIPVHYMVVEEGKYTLAKDGVKMEAVKFTSTRTDENNSWVGEALSYQQTYSQPVVVGQVMSYNDSDWSVFWARGSSKLNPPTNSSLYVGKHVGEDSDNTRANETIGYLVIEAGAGSIGGVGYVAGLGGDTIRGVTDGDGFTYNITHLNYAEFAVASAAGMDGGNGGWPVLYGSAPVTEDTLMLGFDEDQMKDTERAHTTEQVAYIVLDPPAESYATADTNQDGHVTPLDALLVINWLNANTASQTTLATRTLDVNRDGHLTPADALWIINDLNRVGSGEGEATASVTQSSTAARQAAANARALDRIFSELDDDQGWSLTDDLVDDLV